MAVHDHSQDIYTFADTLVTPDHVQDKVYIRQHKAKNTPIVIDNGSWQCRSGWASQNKPCLRFRNILARMRAKKGEGDYTVVGNDIANLETLHSSLRNQFDKNVVLNFTNQEVILDHIFSSMGLGNESCVHHPIVMTEPVCNPEYSRNTMSELLFEGYTVPAVSYGIDGLYSLYHNQGGVVSDGLVVCSGYQTTHILPVLDGKLVASHVKRINIGGLHVSSYLQQLLQLRYPALQSLLTQSRVQEIIEHQCYISTDYQQDLLEGKWESCIVQLPYTDGMSVGSPSDLAEQEERDQQRRGRARQHLLRLSQRKREEKIRDLEERLERLIHLQQLAAVTDSEEYGLILEESGFTSLDSVLKEILSVQEALEIERSKLQNTLDKIHQGESSGGGEGDGVGSDSIDHQWVQTLQLRRKELMDNKRVRLHQKQELSKRRSAASQDRMRIISQLAEDNPVKNGRQHEDTFGMDDEDWNVYRTISKSDGREGSDSEREEAELREITKLLECYDPSSIQLTHKTVAARYQMKLGVERIRAPEIVYQPSMIGVDQCGLTETVELLLNSFPTDIQQRLVNCVHVTGGNANFPQFEQRLQQDLMAIRPFQSTFTIQSAVDKDLGGWMGAAHWAQQGINDKWMTNNQYHEHGTDHWVEHVASNRFSVT